MPDLPAVGRDIADCRILCGIRVLNVGGIKLGGSVGYRDKNSIGTPIGTIGIGYEVVERLTNQFTGLHRAG